MKLGKLISKAISCIDSYINPPTEKELKAVRKAENSKISEKEDNEKDK